MSLLITSLKSEITRVARKELKGELQSLRKASTAHRSEIAALKRLVKSLATEVRAVRRTTKPDLSGPERTAKPSRIRFTAERFSAFRAKLGLTQAEMAKVLGASSLSVHKWETGAVQPRAAQLGKIATIMKLGKRQAKAMLST